MRQSGLSIRLQASVTECPLGMMFSEIEFLLEILLPQRFPLRLYGSLNFPYKFY